MKYTEYTAAIEAAKSSPSAEFFCSEMGYPADCPYSPNNWIAIGRIIFAVSRNDIMALLADYKNLSAFSRAYNLPLRTVQDWKSGRRTPPIYLIEMLGYVLIGSIAADYDITTD